MSCQPMKPRGYIVAWFSLTQSYAARYRYRIFIALYRLSTYQLPNFRSKQQAVDDITSMLLFKVL